MFNTVSFPKNFEKSLKRTKKAQVCTQTDFYLLRLRRNDFQPDLLGFPQSVLATLFMAWLDEIMRVKGRFIVLFGGT